MIYIGIDPGLHTGVCICEGTRIKELFTTDFWDLIRTIEAWKHPFNGISTKFIIEDPNQNKPLFFRKGKERYAGKIGQNVGSNKRESSLIIEYFKKECIDYEAVKPQSSKWDAKYFKMITKCQYKTNEHERDACKLVFGRGTFNPSAAHEAFSV
jgi:hypothetical protein